MLPQEVPVVRFRLQATPEERAAVGSRLPEHAAAEGAG